MKDTNKFRYTDNRVSHFARAPVIDCKSQGVLDWRHYKNKSNARQSCSREKGLGVGLEKEFR